MSCPTFISLKRNAIPQTSACIAAHLTMGKQKGENQGEILNYHFFADPKSSSFHRYLDRYGEYGLVDTAVNQWAPIYFTLKSDSKILGARQGYIE